MTVFQIPANGQLHLYNSCNVYNEHVKDIVIQIHREPRAVPMKLLEPKRKCPKPIPRYFQNHVVWSRVLKCSVKSYAIGPQPNAISMNFYSCEILTHETI